MSNLTTAVNGAARPGAAPRDRKGWSTEQRQAYSAAMKRADDLLDAGNMSRVDWSVYKTLVGLCVRSGLPYTTATAQSITARIARCSVDYLTIVYRRLARLKLIWRERAGNTYRSYVAALAPTPDPEPVGSALPAATRQALVWAALALLGQAARLAGDPAAECAAPPAGDEPEAAASGAVFAPPAPDHSPGRTRSSDRVPSVVKDSGLTTSGAFAPPGHGGGAQSSAMTGAGGSESLPDTPAVRRVRHFAAECGEAVLDRAALGRHAQRAVVEVEQAIVAARQRATSSPVGLLLRMLDEGVWPRGRRRGVRAAPPTMVAAAPVSAGGAAHGNPHAQLWRMVQGELQVACTRQAYDTWFAATWLIDVDDTQARIGCPHVLARERLETQERALLAEVLRKVLGRPVQVEVVIDAGGPPQ